MVDMLRQLEFNIREHEYQDLHGTKKFALEAKRNGKSLRSPDTTETNSLPFGYFCHNDVVSVSGWDCKHGGPFDGVIAEEKLWGRGSCDMKGSAAAALAAISRVSIQDQQAPLYYFVSGDEECGMVGAQLLSETSFFNELVEGNGVGIVGEPTEIQVVNSHKGGAHLDIWSDGFAAHSSTVEGKNANWQLIPFLAYLRELNERCISDAKLCNEDFDPPHLSVNAIIENSPSAPNITVGRATCRIFLRPMPGIEWQAVVDEIVSTAKKLELNVREFSTLPPVHTPASSRFVQKTMELVGQDTPQSVCFATDGCFFGALSDLVVIGPGSIEQAHRSDEFISLQQLQAGTDLFEKMIRQHVCEQTNSYRKQ